MLRRWRCDRFVSTLGSLISLSRNEVYLSNIAQRRGLAITSALLQTDVAPLRKQLKDATRAQKKKPTASLLEEQKRWAETVAKYELTVGIEIHAQLNTSSKLFSRASADYTDVPNAALWPFDFAVPGSQPLFQVPVLIPAIRAALALGCEVQTHSQFDRKHYFYHDQPAGYQITQYYNPFARHGQISLKKQDGLGKDDGDDVTVGIKQIQLEQDTAKTQEQDANTSLIDFNRSGHALIEIISLPHIHSPQAATAYVRKVQSILYAVDAATTGMELGGLRADVNVSVRLRDGPVGHHSYSGVKGLGQRTEIKNLSSFKSVEDAVTAERNRQITILESGGTVEGETRGWSLSSPHETRRLRGKEGEVDYRYMPDPDIPPLNIDISVLEHLQNTMPPVPEVLVEMLRATYGLTLEDATALLSLDSGARLIYYQDVVQRCRRSGEMEAKFGVLAGNWILHEFGALLTQNEKQWSPDLIHPQQMADLLKLHADDQITGTSAKQLLRILFDGDKGSVSRIVERENLQFIPLTNEEYNELASQVIEANDSAAEIVRQNGRQAPGKLKFLLGQMMRQGDRNRMEPLRAEIALQRILSSKEDKT